MNCSETNKLRNRIHAEFPNEGGLTNPITGIFQVTWKATRVRLDQLKYLMESKSRSAPKR